MLEAMRASGSDGEIFIFEVQTADLRVGIGDGAIFAGLAPFGVGSRIDIFDVQFNPGVLPRLRGIFNFDCKGLISGNLPGPGRMIC